MNASSYIHGDSFYHRFDVRPKLISTLLFAAIAFAMRSWVGLAAAFLLPLALLFVAVGTREAWRCLLRLLPLFAILVQIAEPIPPILALILAFSQNPIAIVSSFFTH